MKLCIILKNAGGELAREFVETPEGAPVAGRSEDFQIHAVIQSWILSAGDVIEIVQVRS